MSAVPQQQEAHGRSFRHTQVALFLGDGTLLLRDHVLGDQFSTEAADRVGVGDD
jgi:hypothetical protein